jgi:hypothetical protein
MKCGSRLGFIYGGGGAAACSTRTGAPVAQLRVQDVPGTMQPAWINHGQSDGKTLEGKVSPVTGHGGLWGL